MEKQIGEFKVNGMLGKGSISTVYSAIDGGGNEIALKIMQESPFIENTVLEHILENAEVTLKMPPHPKITQLLAYGKIDSSYYISMTLIRGPGTLEKMMAERRLELNTALRLSLDIADALTHAHNSNIVHGDLKPGNILINEKNEAILNDFGSVTSVPSASLDFGRVMVGTPKYMSPDQAKGMYISQNSDIYSFGVVLYEMVTGQLPYQMDPGTNLQKMRQLIIESEPIPPRKLNKELSPRLNSFLIKLLEKDEEDRYNKISLVRDELESIINGQDQSQETAPSLWHRIGGLFRSNQSGGIS